VSIFRRIFPIGRNFVAFPGLFGTPVARISNGVRDTGQGIRDTGYGLWKTVNGYLGPDRSLTGEGILTPDSRLLTPVSCLLTFKNAGASGDVDENIRGIRDTGYART
jgi:hypothetical protein